MYSAPPSPLEKILDQCGQGGHSAGVADRSVGTENIPAAAPRLSPDKRQLTCMPQTLTPSVADVLCSHFLICRAAFSAEASSPCCRVPIFRSSTQGYLKWCTTFSSRRNSGPRSRRMTTTLTTSHGQESTSEFSYKRRQSHLMQFVFTSQTLKCELTPLAY